MFVTHPAFKLPVQFAGVEINWRSVEVAIRASFFMLTTKDTDDGVARDFFLGTEADLTQFIERKPVGQPVSLSLMLCPGFSQNGSWQVVPIRRVDREERAAAGERATLVFTAENGHRYSGFPAERVNEFEGNLVPMMAFA